jgi:hypothetical protein
MQTQRRFSVHSFFLFYGLQENGLYLSDVNFRPGMQAMITTIALAVFCTFIGADI